MNAFPKKNSNKIPNARVSSRTLKNLLSHANVAESNTSGAFKSNSRQLTSGAHLKEFTNLKQLIEIMKQ